jgi:hypothetical protein
MLACRWHRRCRKKGLRRVPLTALRIGYIIFASLRKGATTAVGTSRTSGDVRLESAKSAKAVAVTRMQTVAFRGSRNRRCVAALARCTAPGPISLQLCSSAATARRKASRSFGASGWAQSITVWSSESLNETGMADSSRRHERLRATLPRKLLAQKYRRAQSLRRPSRVAGRLARGGSDQTGASR